MTVRMKLSTALGQNIPQHSPDSAARLPFPRLQKRPGAPQALERRFHHHHRQHRPRLDVSAIITIISVRPGPTDSSPSSAIPKARMFYTPTISFWMSLRSSPSCASSQVATVSSPGRAPDVLHTPQLSLDSAATNASGRLSQVTTKPLPGSAAIMPPAPWKCCALLRRPGRRRYHHHKRNRSRLQPIYCRAVPQTLHLMLRGAARSPAVPKRRRHHRRSQHPQVTREPSPEW